MGEVERGPARDAAGGPTLPWSLSSRWRLFGTLFVALAVPLAALAGLVADRAREALHGQADHAGRTTAHLTALLVREHFNGLKFFLTGIATRQRFRDAIARRDAAAIREHLADVVQYHPEFDRAYVTDPDGNEWVNHPDDPAVLNQNFADRDWYRGVRGANETYVSRPYVRAGTPHAQVVAVAAPVRDEAGALLGYLVAQNPTEALAGWLVENRPSEEGTLALVDPSGRLAAGADEGGVRPNILDLSAHPAVLRSRTAGTGTVGAPDPLSRAESRVSFHVVPGYGWAVLAGQPESAVLAPAEALVRSVGLLALTAFLAIFTLGALWLNAIRRYDVALADRTAQLARSNTELAQLAADLEVTTAAVSKSHTDLKRAHAELQRTEAHLVQAEKLTALGQMVAGVAHEINNPLAFVTNNVAVLQRDVGHLNELIGLYQQAETTLAEHQRELLDRVRALAEQIDLPYVLDNLPAIMSRSREGLRRIQQIVKDLRNFARLDEAELAEADLRPGLEFTATMIRPRARERGVNLRTELAEVQAVTCYPAKVNQVVLNLLTNAVDACDHGGEVVLRCRPGGPRGGPGVTVEVSDTGAGIDPAVRNKIFDPFFTTKPVGKGTGLGLSISYGIVKAHGGKIEVDSHVGRGTRFTVRLPSHPPTGGAADAAGRSWIMPAPKFD